MYAGEFELSEKEQIEYEKQSKEIKYNSALGFLQSHRGIREHKMHLLIAPTHSGKSTMVRSILRDFIFKNKEASAMLWLTEETKTEFQVEFLKGVPNHDILKNLRVFSEQDWDGEEASKIMHFIEECVEMYDLDLLVIDNITTSPVYNDQTIKRQSEITNWLKRLSKKVTLFVIAHSNTNDFNNRFLDESDIRGSKAITNLTEFLYILQPVHVGSTLHQFINIRKHRGQSVDKKYWKLVYNPNMFSFTQDYSVEFEQISEMFQLRNQLGKKK